MTPDPGSRIMGGGADLQAAINTLTKAVGDNTAALQRSSSSAPGGTPVPFGNTGQTFTSGSFPKMSAASFTGWGGGGGQNNATQATNGGSGGPASTLASAGQSLGNMASAAMGSGSTFSNRLLMNQFASQSSLMMGPGNAGAQQQQMYRMAFGSYGQPAGLSAIATGAADQAQMWSNLQGAAGGVANPYSTQQGRSVVGATGALGYANPTLGGAQSAAAIQQLYSPQTSYLMRQLGYGALPRAGANGGWANGSQVVSGMMQRWYGRGSVSQGTLNAGLAPGGKVALNMQALGLDPNTYGPMLQMYNKLAQQGVGGSQADAMLQAAAGNKQYDGQSAQKLLSNKYGIATSDVQKYKDITATKTANTSGGMGAFDSQVSQATTALRGFNQILGKILKATGLGNMAAGGSAWANALGNVPVVGSLFKDASQMLNFGGGALPGGNSGSGMGSPGSKNTVSSISPQAKNAIKDAEAQVGKPYQWGGDTPQTSFDCSGLVEWAYAQAGIRLPRTSQAQWAALKGKSVPLRSVMAGDIVFSAGSDGTADSPGHEAMMISNKQIVEAPSTGQKIRIRSFDPGEWQHAARPTGNLKASGGGGALTQNGIGNASSTTGQGNSGSGVGGVGAGGSGGAGGLGLAVGNYGSSNEADSISGALLGGFGAGSGGGGLSTYTGSVGGSIFGNSSAGNGQGSTKNVGKANGRGKIASNATASQAQAIAKKLASAYGWASGGQWQALLQLWQDESSWRWDAQNPHSPAYGIPQADPGNKMASAGADWRTNPSTQIKWGLGYIKQRYGSPSVALQSENSIHSYAAGTGYAGRGLALVGERGPELVHLSGGQEVSTTKETSDILKGHAAKPSQGPWSTGTAQQLMLANAPQNQQNQRYGGRCEVSLNMPAGAIVIHTQGSATDVSNATRQIMQGVSQAMAEDETLKKIMAGVTS